MPNRYKVNRPIMASPGKVLATGFEGPLDDLADEDIADFLKLGAITQTASEDDDDAVTSQGLDEDQLETLKAIVKELMDADPDRNKPPTVKAVVEKTKFDVTGAEIKEVFDSLNAENNPPE